jgi:hypothetical protein
VAGVASTHYSARYTTNMKVIKDEIINFETEANDGYRLFINDSLLCLVPENNTHLCQWVFSAPAQSPILKFIIDLSVERIKNTDNIKGEHIIHHLTGPEVFTDGIEKYLKENNCPYFQDKKNYFPYFDHNILRVFNCNNFHKNVVIHLYAGQDKDGWFHERYKKLL